jgi:hypothetical protein
MIERNGVELGRNGSDRLPPHSGEAEQGILGCCLWNSACVEEVERAAGGLGAAGLFYDLRHSVIFGAIARLREFDLITLQQELKDRGELDRIGGIAYLSGLQDCVPSAANLVYYLDIAVEKARLRHLISTCRDVAARAEDCGGSVEEFLWAAQSDLVGMLGRAAGERDVESWSIRDLAGYGCEEDANCILGVKDGKTTRYLCRGHGAWLIGPSGVGKSSLAVQEALLWAAGRAFCGIAPVRPLRVLIVQAENDKGDASEQVQGILAGMGINEFDTPEVFELVWQNVRFETERELVGPRFVQWLERRIARHRAELVVVDPLLSFAGIDVSRQDQTTNFLRAVLNPVLADTGAVMIGAHHTGKPKNAKDTANWTIYDHAYAGIGSSELVNWARAISVLVPLGDGRFELRLAKRGARAWARHPDGQRTTSLYLKHGDERIFWEQTAPPEASEAGDGGSGEAKEGGRPSAVKQVLGLGLGPLIDGLTEGVGLNRLAEMVDNFAAGRRLDVKRWTCKRVVAELVANGALVKVEGKYRKA